MPALDHTIVAAGDHRHAATTVAAVVGLPSPITHGPFEVVRVDAVTTLDFVHVDGPITSQHYAFLVTEAEFDDVLSRILERGMPYWADPGHGEPGEINTWDGGRGVYFDDPSGHRLEALTRPYGSGGSTTSRPHPLGAERPADHTPNRTKERLS